VAVRGPENSLNLAIDRPGAQDELDRSGEELTLDLSGKCLAGVVMSKKRMLRLSILLMLFFGAEPKSGGSH
jgi:hypothetical protein